LQFYTEENQQSGHCALSRAQRCGCTNNNISFGTSKTVLVPLLNAFCVQLKYKTLTNIKHFYLHWSESENEKTILLQAHERTNKQTNIGNAAFCASVSLLCKSLYISPPFGADRFIKVATPPTAAITRSSLIL